MSEMNLVADVFLSTESKEILKNKYVLLIGDSVIRGMYKDLVKFLQKDEYLEDYQLKNKGEFRFENDTLLEGGQKGNLSNDITYTEVREFKTNYNLVRFYFVTRCYSDYLKSICEDIKNEVEKPDLVIMNSGCWDLTRYGINSINDYKKNLPLGIYSLIKVLPCYTLFLWTTTLPLSKEVKGGFMIPEAECHQSKLREDVLEANKYAVNVMDEFKLDLLDLHFYFRNQIQRRAKDGIHWDATAHRRITNLILHHCCDAWDLDTPGRIVMKRKIDQEEIDYDTNACFEKTQYLNKSIKNTGPPQSVQLGQTNNNQKRRKQYRKNSNSTVLLNQSWGNNSSVSFNRDTGLNIINSSSNISNQLNPMPYLNNDSQINEEQNILQQFPFINKPARKIQEQINPVQNFNYDGSHLMNPLYSDFNGSFNNNNNNYNNRYYNNKNGQRNRKRKLD